MDFRYCYLKSPLHRHPKTDLVMQNLSILRRLQIWLPQIAPSPKRTFSWRTWRRLQLYRLVEWCCAKTHSVSENCRCILSPLRFPYYAVESSFCGFEICPSCEGLSLLLHFGLIISVCGVCCMADVLRHNGYTQYEWESVSKIFFLISCFPGFGDYECKRIFHLSEHDICVSFLIFSLDFHQCVTKSRWNILFSYYRCPFVVLYLDSINKIYQNSSCFKHGLQLFHYYYGRISIF